MTKCLVFWREGGFFFLGGGGGGGGGLSKRWGSRDWERGKNKNRRMKKKKKKTDRKTENERGGTISTWKDELRNTTKKKAINTPASG